MIHRLQTKGLGEIQFLITKGAIAEVEYFFKKPIINLIATEWTTKHWYVTAFECYKMACLKNKEKVEHSLVDFQTELDDDFTELVSLFDTELDKLLGLSELAKKLGEAKKKK